MPEIGNAIYLLAALGIAVPIIIHLWNRKPPRIIEVGSVRWLRGSSTQSARRLRPEQWPLLLLRCLMLLLFSLLLAGLYWESPSRDEPKASLYLIHAQQLEKLGEADIDSLLDAGMQPRLLAPGLPLLEDSIRWKNRAINIWAILREADTRREFSDTVWISSLLQQANFNGERPRLHKTYRFLDLEDKAETARVYAEAFQQEDKVILQQAFSAAGKIRVQTDTILQNEWAERGQDRSISAETPADLKVSLLAAEAYTRDAGIIQYAIEAAVSIDPSRKLLLNSEMGEADGSHVLFWLNKEPVPSRLQEEAFAIVLYDSVDNNAWEWLVQDYNNPQQAVFYLSARPLPERVSREKLARLPLELVYLLNNKEPEDLSRFLPMPVEQAMPLRADGGVVVEAEVERTDLHVYLWLLLFGLFVIERIWVYKS